MPVRFEPISIDKQEAYALLLAESIQPASDYSFVNLWGWADEYGLEWAWEDGIVWIKQNVPKPLYWAPVGDWENVNWKEIFSRHFSCGTEFTRVPEKLAELWKDNIEQLSIEPVRGHFDYLYSATELVELKGNRYHKKKNLISQFVSAYQFTYTMLDESKSEKALSLQDDWCTWKDCDSHEILASENRVIEKILKNWVNLKGLTGGAIFVNDVIVAYTVAEMISADTLVIHFEKGNPDYKGVYQAINNMFLTGFKENYKGGNLLVNREQDLDDEGLRKAKLSYNPIDLLKKYRCRL